MISVTFMKYSVDVTGKAEKIFAKRTCIVNWAKLVETKKQAGKERSSCWKRRGSLLFFLSQNQMNTFEKTNNSWKVLQSFAKRCAVSDKRHCLGKLVLTFYARLPNSLPEKIRRFERKYNFRAKKQMLPTICSLNCR